MRARLLLASILLATAGCTVGAPPGFSSGDSWSFPLVGPLEGGPLVVPVMVHDQGPYLFLIDPDSPVSQIDVALASELGLRTGQGPEFVDETDKARPIGTAEVLRIKLGNLQVRQMTFFAMPVGAFNTGGRQIRGVIGHDVLADSLTFGFDRDRGMGYIATQKGFQKPAGAIAIDYRRERTKIGRGIPAVSRRMAGVVIGGTKLSMHLDFGDVHSQMRESKWGAAGLIEIAVKRALVDEVGTARTTERGGIAQAVQLGGATTGDVLFVPYADRRWSDQVIDGTLGLNFFDDYTVWANWDDDQLFLVPRDKSDHVKERIDRWGSPALSACQVPACTVASLLVPQSQDAPGETPPPAPAPPPADAAAIKRPAIRPILHVERSAEVADVAFEVLLEARTASGEPAGLPRMIAIFPAGETQLTQPLDDSYADTSIAVLDVSPFVRACPREGACVYVLSETK